jgi:hypothetical protein
MRARILVAASIVMAALTTGILSASDAGGSPSKQWSPVFFAQPTVVAGRVIQGAVMFVHDDQRMAEGGACTSVYRFDPASGPKELIVSFMCKPERTKVVDKFTASCIRDGGNLQILTAYQFAGETEAHGVPASIYEADGN